MQLAALTALSPVFVVAELLFLLCLSSFWFSGLVSWFSSPGCSMSLSLPFSVIYSRSTSFASRLPYLSFSTGTVSLYFPFPHLFSRFSLFGIVWSLPVPSRDHTNVSPFSLSLRFHTPVVFFVLLLVKVISRSPFHLHFHATPYIYVLFSHFLPFSFFISQSTSLSLSLITLHPPHRLIYSSLVFLFLVQPSASYIFCLSFLFSSRLIRRTWMLRS